MFQANYFYYVYYVFIIQPLGVLATGPQQRILEFIERVNIYQTKQNNRNTHLNN